jgi:hypothetical protein
VICVEPSPDVATSIASSLGFGVSVLGQGAGSISGSSVEGLVQLGERTIAVQALLKQGYQACLDYANGAITATTYSIRTSKLDDLLVTLVLGEIAGGEFGRSGATIGGKSDSSASASVVGTGIPEIDSKERERELQNAEKDVIESENKLQTQQEELDKERKKGTTGDALKPFEEAVSNARTELIVATAKRNAALRKLVASGITSTTAGAETESVVGFGSLSRSPTKEIAETIHQMQKEFILKDIDNVYISTCMAELGFSASDNINTNYEIINTLDKNISKSINDKGYTLLNDDNFATAAGYVNTAKWKSGLYDHCKTNLTSFILLAHNDRLHLEQMRLENESKQLDKQKQTQEHSLIEGIGHHPIYGYQLLQNADNILRKKHSELEEIRMPEVKDKFTEEQQKALTKEINELSTEVRKHLEDTMKMLSANKKQEIDNMENEFIQIISDLKRSGTPAERKLWSIELAYQQAKAEVEYIKYENLIETSTVMTQKENEFINKVKKYN